jgi:hypothetical protein
MSYTPTSLLPSRLPFQLLGVTVTQSGALRVVIFRATGGPPLWSAVPGGPLWTARAAPPLWSAVPGTYN